MKRLFTIAGGAALVASAFVLAEPAGAGNGVYLTVVKEVQGAAPADAEFVIEVECAPIESSDSSEAQAAVEPASIPGVFGETFTFGPEGGEDQLIIPRPVECTVTETADGGADEVIGGEQTVVFDEPASQEAVVVNVFEPEPTTLAPTTSAPTTTSTAAAAARVVAAPRFTG